MNANVRSPLATPDAETAPTVIQHLQTANSQILIHTDGACIGNPGPGGWAFSFQRTVAGEVIDDQCQSGGETQKTTNNRMELQAAIEALRAIPPNETAPITIHSDSQLLIKGMTEWIANWIKNGWKNASRKPVANRDQWEQILDLSKGLNITWKWVKGHAGDAQNERVDGLAEGEARAAAQAAVVARFKAE